MKVLGNTKRFRNAVLMAGVISAFPIAAGAMVTDHDVLTDHEVLKVGRDAGFTVTKKLEDGIAAAYGNRFGTYAGTSAGTTAKSSGGAADGNAAAGGRESGRIDSPIYLP